MSADSSHQYLAEVSARPVAPLDCVTPKAQDRPTHLACENQLKMDDHRLSIRQVQVHRSSEKCGC